MGVGTWKTVKRRMKFVERNILSLVKRWIETISVEISATYCI